MPGTAAVKITHLTRDRSGKLRAKGVEETFRKPECVNGHSGDDIIKLHGRWVCRVCLKVDNVAARGIVLPPGVDPKQVGAVLDIRDVFPNRDARKRADSL